MKSKKILLPDQTVATSRRRFLKLGLAVAGGTLLPAGLVQAKAASRAECALSFYNTHTGERCNAVYQADGRLVEDGLRQINWILRDFRSGEVERMDLSLLELLTDLRSTLGTDKPFQIISGYRSPATNSMLRHSGGGGVAKKSLHMQAKAIDIRIDGVALHHLRDAAKSLQAGGVGYYPGSDFVHVDVGRVRYW